MGNPDDTTGTRDPSGGRFWVAFPAGTGTRRVAAMTSELRRRAPS